MIKRQRPGGLKRGEKKKVSQKRSRRAIAYLLTAPYVGGSLGG